MSISYKKMWVLLAQKEMSKADLRKAADISPNTMTKLRRNEPVNLATLEKVCTLLNVDFGDLIEHIPDGVSVEN
jgi:DNA-binding Xre family transcriptional regulator